MLTTMKRVRALALACGACAIVPALAGANADTFTGGSNSGSPFSWADGANWSDGIPSSTSQVQLPDFTTAATIDLGGVVRSVDTLTFTNTAPFPTTPYTLTNGTLSANQITNTNYTNDPNVIEADVMTPGNTLGIATLDGTMNITGTVTAPNIAYTNVGGPGQAHLLLANSNNNITGTITLESDHYQGVDLILGAPGAAGSAFIQGNDGANISFTPVDQVTTYSNSISVISFGNVRIQPTVSAAAQGGTVTAGTLTFAHPNDFAFFESNGNVTLGFTNTVLNGGTSIYSYTFDGNNRAYMDLGAVSEATPGSSLSQYGFGTVTVSGSATYTGNTFCSNGMLIGAVADAFSVGTDINTGQVFAQTNGAIEYAVPQAALHRTFIDAYGALVGDFTGAIFSGAGQNVFYSDGSILVPTAGPVPQRGVDIDHPTFLMGITTDSFDVTVGEDVGQTSIYKGIAFGNYSTPGRYFGSVSENMDGEGFEVYLDRGFRDFSGVSFNTTNTDTGVHFLGSGEARIGASHGTATVFTHTGAVNGDSTGLYVMSFGDHSTLKSGEVVNISNGILFTGYPDSVDDGANVNIHNTGTYFIGAFDTIPDGSPISGTFNIDAGGAVYINNPNFTLAAGATFNFAPDSLLVFETYFSTIDTGTPTWLPSNADIVVKNSQTTTAFIGSGLVLGDQRRLTTGSNDSAILSGGTGISAQPMATSVGMSAANGHFLRIFDDVNLAGVNLVIGNQQLTGSGGGDSRFTTVGNFADRQSVFQNGTVDLRGNVTTNDITVYSGDFYVGAALTSPLPLSGTLSVHDFNMNSSGKTSLSPSEFDLSGTINQTNGFIFLNSPVNYASGAAINITGGYINFQSSTRSTLTDARHQLTIGPAGVVYVDGPADPFSDGTGKTFDIANDGAMYVYTSSSVGNVDGAGLLEIPFATSFDADHIRQSTLNIDAGGIVTIHPDGGANGVSRLTNLTIGEFGGIFGKLDLIDNDLIIDYDPTLSPIATIRSYLTSGFNAGNWNGQGINSSTAHADVNFRTVLGYAIAGDLGTGSFDGQFVDPSTILVKFTYYGDANLDGEVDSADFRRFLDGLATNGSMWDQGDFTYDGKVDLGNDFNLFLISYLKHGGALGDLAPIIESDTALSVAQKAQMLAVVPEPASMALLALGAVPLAMRRRRKYSIQG